MPRVRLLPPELADRIAAGEVVERPASAVKELMENSLDAGADNIRVTVRGGGLEYLAIRDNGVGMRLTDAQMALKRHATSKINDEADLFRIMTMGFRGEAIPAIASVSKFSLTTREPSSPEGLRLEVIGGVSVGEPMPVGAPPGTTIEVRDLFHNTPARLKFMKTARTEMAWIKESVIRLSLARPDVYFRLDDDDRTVLNLPAVERGTDRLDQVFGSKVARNMLDISENHPAVKVSGWVGSPETAKAGTKTVYSFVNGRFIKDRLVLAALASGYQGRLDRGRYPTTVLFLDLEPGTVDVNVHPAKLEVRFHHSQAIHQAIRKAVTASLDDQDRTFTPQTSHSYGSSKMTFAVSEPRTRAGWGATQEQMNIDRRSSWYGPQTQTPHSLLIAHPNGQNRQDDQIRAIEHPSAVGAGLIDFRYLGRYGGTYLIGQAGDDLVLIDQHAAHERVLYNRLVTEPGQSQPLLLPAQLILSPLEADALIEAVESLSDLGLIVEQFGPDGRTFIIKSIPLPLARTDPIDLVAGLAAEIVSGHLLTELDNLTKTMASQACKAALKAGQKLTDDEVTALIEEVIIMPPPLTCPHGRPILRRFTKHEIDAGFKRT